MALGKLKEKKGQSYAQCCFHGCTSKGRILARLNSVEIAYCALHRKKYGERVLNALVNARFNGKLSNFLSDVKTHMFVNTNSHLCESCQEKELNYIKSKIAALAELENEANTYNLNKDNLNEQTDDSEWIFDDETK